MRVTRPDETRVTRPDGPDEWARGWISNGHFHSDTSKVEVGYWYGLVLLKMS